MIKKILPKKGARVLVLRTSELDGTACNGFKWPKKGYVACKDWSPEKVCGQGLHGLLKGEQSANAITNENGLWQVVEVLASEVVDLNGKVKFPRGIVLYSGDRATAVAMIKARHPEACVHWSTATAGIRGTATAGDRGTATAGNAGTAKAGDCGTISISYWDGEKNRYRIATGGIGANGLLANVRYQFDADTKAFKPCV